jgi:hypothetical protein
LILILKILKKNINKYKNLMPQAGIEPTSLDSKTNILTVKLLRHSNRMRVVGIEPTALSMTS